MSDEPLTRAVLASTLAEFHRAIVLPDLQRIVGEAVGEAIGDFRREVNGHFDDIYRRFERLETEYGSLKAGLARVEERLERIDERLERVDERLERLELTYGELLAAVHRLEERLSRVERQVNELAAAQEKHALRSEVQDLKARVDALRDDIRRLEQRLQV